MSQSFLHKEVPALGKRVFRLGLSVNYGLDEAGARAAFERGMNYVLYVTRGRGRLDPALRDALKRDRDKLVIAAGPTLGFFGGSFRGAAEELLRSLGTDYIDVLQLYWLGRTSALTEGTQAELVKLKEEGKIRAIGCSIHDRVRAGQLAESSVLDLLMIRYNAAHPGAERDIFPRLERRQPAIVAYTATSWRKLLKRPSGWTGPVMTAGDCYRFCLSSPHVDVALTGPANEAQLDENLRALERGPLSEDEMRWMRDFGRAAHG
jgi:aryl-alcohol dehydrogenase-like predicted oxidoreductase